VAERRRTSTSDFGAGRRESHDASGFYGRFDPPVLDDDETVAEPRVISDPFVHGDARDLSMLDDRSVALVVTSPPYFAGKQYENELERDGIPASYIEYLTMLGDVFAECVRVLEPGGRIAINIANLGRRPFRSLTADVINLLQDRLGLLLRGEIVWRKGAGANGSCAWGSYRSASNPVLRDLTERVVVASKGRFQRALTPARRERAGLPFRSTISAEDFMAGTLDLWDIPTESARRVGHPAPFPVELPARLIELYTYADDLVLDPFMGSGSTLVAASRLGRRYVGVDLDAEYVALARERVASEGAASDAIWDGASGRDVIERVLSDAGFVDVTERRVAGLSATIAVDRAGGRWAIEVGGAFARERTGLTSGDALWRSIARSAVLSGAGERVLLLTSAAPVPGSEGAGALRAVTGLTVTEVIEVFNPDSIARLNAIASGG
jgi:DNA modification methylase